MILDVTGVLLAGGKSRRMGEDKRYLHVGAQTLLERSLAILQSVFQSVLVVIAQDSPDLDIPAPVTRDLVTHGGSLGGLYTGLKQASTSHVFAVACDMPFLNPRVIQYFTDLQGSSDIVMPELHNRLHPLHALYSRRCLPIIEEMLTAGELKIQKLIAHPSLCTRILTAQDLRQIDPDERSFLNINTPEDLETARLLIECDTDPHSPDRS